VNNGQSVKLVNEATGDEAECIIAYVMKVGASFVVPNPNFWRVTFPPQNWTPLGVEGF
jgi:hypothetical protein